MPSRTTCRSAFQNMKDVRAQARLGESHPAVLPHSSGVVEERLYFQQSAPRSFSGGAAACNVLEKSRFAKAKRQIAMLRRTDDDGLEFVLAAGGGV